MDDVTMFDDPGFHVGPNCRCVAEPLGSPQWVVVAMEMALERGSVSAVFREDFNTMRRGWVAAIFDEGV